MIGVRRFARPLVGLGTVAVLTLAGVIARPYLPGSLGSGGELGRVEATTLQAVPGTWVSAITVLNPNQTATTVVLEFYDANGAKIDAATQSESVAAGKTMFRFVPNVTGLPNGVYSVVVLSELQVYASVNLNTQASTAPVMGESYNGVQGPGATKFYVASVLRDYYGFTSNVTVQNVPEEGNPVAATVSLRIVGVGSKGAVDITKTSPTAVQPNASYTFDLDSMSTELGNNFAGAATATGTKTGGGAATVAVVSATYTPPAATQPQASPLYLVGNGMPAGAPQAYVPGLYKNYYGFFTALTVQNVDPSGPADIVVTYSNGATDTKTGLASGSSVLFFTPNNASLPSGTSGAVSAVVRATNGKNIIAQINVQTSQGVGLASYTGFTDGTTKVYAPGLLKAYYGYNSALTVQNVETALDANVTVTYSNGYTYSRVIGAGKSLLLYTPNEPNASVPPGFNGGATIVSTNGAKIVGLINLQGDPNNDQLFSTNAFGSN